jgi:UDP-N-acetylglucosamine transferase subunit ALG13
LIFVTLGTHGQPFARALELVAGLATDEEVLIQRGTTLERRDLIDAKWVDYLEWNELGENMRRADVVISHAGVGSMVTAIRAGKKPVAVPRLARFGEHVDDHQVQLAERFAERNLALAYLLGDNLDEAVAEARHVGPPSLSLTRQTGLRKAVATAALGT